MTDLQSHSTSARTADDHTACPACNSPVAPDQRYCLNCGARQAEPRVDFVQLLAGNGGGRQADSGGAGSSQPPPRDWTPVLALGGLAALALVLVVGVLIGRGGGNTAKQAAAPQIITVGGGAGAGTSAGTSATSASLTKISDDWPAGTDGWTVQLQTLRKAGATAASVTAAKSAASSKGAPKVGVLDAANYKSLGSGYIIYSGVDKTRKDAEAALGKLKKSFPDAKVIHVVPGGGAAGAGASGGVGSPVSAAQQQQGAATIQKFQQACGSGNAAQCSKATKTTTPIATPGAPPPADNKPAGGGSAAQTIN